MTMRSLLALIFVFGALVPASASHFRYGHISYTTPDPINQPRTVEITIDVGWRGDAVGAIIVFFGDTTAVQVLTSSWDVVSAPLSDGQGEQYRLVSKTVTHTYPANGDYTVFFQDCCRVSTLRNNPNGGFRVDTTVRIGTDLNSVKAQIPAIIGMTKNAMNNLPLATSMFDPDADAFTCAYATGNGDYATVPQANSQSLSVTPDCRLQWDLTGYNPTNAFKWGVTIVITNSKGLRQILDFIVELGAGTQQVTCPEVGHNHGFMASVGDHVHADFTIGVTGAVNPKVGDITVQPIGLPPSAAIKSPLDNGGTATDPLPGTWSFHWEVPAGTPDGNYVTNIQWFYPGAGSCLQTVNVLVASVRTPDPPSPGGFGDPHILTWGGEYFDFMGSACDVVLAKSPSFGNGLGLAVHVRLKSRTDYSYIEAAAVQIGDDVLEVSAYGAYFIDSVSNAGLPVKLADQYLVTKEEKNQHDITYTIHVNYHDRIVVKAFKDLVSVRFDGADEDEFKDVVGLMGDFSGTHYSRDRTQIIKDSDAFGQEWQVQPGVDPEIFVTKSASQGKGCMLPTLVAKDGRRRLGETISVEAATKACEHLSTKGAVSACIYDVIATGDLETAGGAY